MASQLTGLRNPSVTCLTTDAYLTAEPGVASSIPARSHTFVEIDQEIISTVNLLPSADSFIKGCCQLQAKICAQNYWLTACSSLPWKIVWLGELTEKKIHFLCEDGIKKSVPHSHRWSSLGKPCDAKQ